MQSQAMPAIEQLELSVIRRAPIIDSGSKEAKPTAFNDLNRQRAILPA
jgi:hypothetical protein